MKKIQTKQLIYAAVFAALCFAVTYVVVIPMPYGYLNFGDVIVLLCSWFLGPIGAIAAGVGCALADLLSGYAIYAPATFVIKSVVAIVGYTLFCLFSKLNQASS